MNETNIDKNDTFIFDTMFKKKPPNDLSLFHFKNKEINVHEFLELFKTKKTLDGFDHNANCKMQKLREKSLSNISKTNYFKIRKKNVLDELKYKYGFIKNNRNSNFYISDYLENRKVAEMQSPKFTQRRVTINFINKKNKNIQICQSKRKKKDSLQEEDENSLAVLFKGIRNKAIGDFKYSKKVEEAKMNINRIIKSTREINIGKRMRNEQKKVISSNTKSFRNQSRLKVRMQFENQFKNSISSIIAEKQKNSYHNYLELSLMKSKDNFIRTKYLKAFDIENKGVKRHEEYKKRQKFFLYLNF